MANKVKNLDRDIDADTRHSYAAVAASGKNTEVATMQKIARAWLAHDRHASKTARAEVARFADMSLDEHNVNWMTQRSFTEALNRALVDSAQNDNRGANAPDHLDGGDEAARHRRHEIRSAVYSALVGGASPNQVSAIIDAMGERPRRKRKPKDDDEARAE